MAKLLSYRVLSIAMYAFVGVYALFVLLPLSWMVFAAFKTKREIFVDPLGLPSTLSLTSFARAWNVGLPTFMLNSVLVTSLSVFLIVLASGMAAYVLARSEVPAMRWIYLLIVAGFAVPLHSVLVPLYQMLSAAGFLNSRLAMVLPTAAFGIPFTTILFYAFFLDFPQRAGGRGAARQLQPLPDLLADYPSAVWSRARFRLDLPGGVHLERIPARAAHADAPGAEDAAGRDFRACEHVHLGLAGDHGRPLDRHSADRHDVFLHAEILRQKPPGTRQVSR